MIATVKGPGASSDPTSRRRGRRVSRLSLGHLVPVLLAVLAGVFVLGALAQRSAMISVAVARIDIGPGAPVNASDVTWVKTRADSGLARDGLVTSAGLGGAKVAAVRIGAGQVITASELTPASAGAGAGSMSIQVSLSRADGGDLVSGDRVDVISMANGGAVYVATNLVVLGVAAQAGGVLGSEAGGSYFVTVAVDRPTALAIAAAEGAASGGSAGGIEIVRSTGEGPARAYPSPAATPVPARSAG